MAIQNKLRFPLAALHFAAILLAACIAGEAALFAGEIQLHAEASASQGIVHLGDVADIYVTDEALRDSLRGIELFPAPAAGSSRSIRAREIQDLLVLRGINLTEHRLSGASQVVIKDPSAGGRGGPGMIKATTTGMENQAAVAVRDAISLYVAAQNNNQDTYDAELTLSDAQVRLLAGAGYKVVASGGGQPWTGSQRFAISVTGAKVQTFTVDALVRPVPTVVVAVHSIARGAVVQEDDVKVEHVRPTGDATDLYDRVVAVVGLETTRTIGAGQFLDRESIRQPIYVRKGDAVTVYARSAGLRVRTTARATDDGSLGDLIKVESMLNRQGFFARVIGPQEVEIYARAPDTGANRRTAPQANAAR